MKTGLIPALTGLLLLSACGSSTTEADPGFAFRIERTSAITAEDAVPRGTDGGITVTGHTWGSECGSVGAAVRRIDEDQLTLVVTHYGSDKPCIAVAVPLEYSASIGELEPGRYHLQVLHTGEPPTEPRTVFHDFVQVQ